jgi:hypothetical protein
MAEPLATTKRDANSKKFYMRCTSRRFYPPIPRM